MSISMEEYYARSTAKMFNIIENEDEKTQHDFFVSMRQLVNLPEIIESDQKYRRLDEDKKYPLIYNYYNWIKRLFPINSKVMDKMTELFPEQMVNTNDFKKIYYETMEKEYPFLHHKCIDFFYGESKQQVLMTHNWNVYKQVYQFDENCFEYLLNNTTYGKIPVDVLSKNLPFKAFAINNSFEIGEFKVTQIVINKILDDFDKEILGVYILNEAPDYDYAFVNIPLEEGNKTIEDIIDYEFAPNIKEVMRKIVSLLLYLCTSNKEVRYIEKKNGYEKNKEKYRKRVGIKCEEVGYILGNTIRQYKTKYITNDYAKAKEPSSSKRPHLRAGHFHHYWTGNGRTNLTVKFVDSVFVHGSPEKVVLHKVKKEKE